MSKSLLTFPGSAKVQHDVISSCPSTWTVESIKTVGFTVKEQHMNEDNLPWLKWLLSHFRADVARRINFSFQADLTDRRKEHYVQCVCHI